MPRSSTPLTNGASLGSTPQRSWAVTPDADRIELLRDEVRSLKYHLKSIYRLEDMIRALKNHTHHMHTGEVVAPLSVNEYYGETLSTPDRLA